MIYCTALLLLVSSFAADPALEAECPPGMTYSIGIGEASRSGFAWLYDIQIPDLTYETGFIHWDLTLGQDGPVEPVVEPCSGEIELKEYENHVAQHVDCTLIPGGEYRFLVRVTILDRDVVDCTVLDRSVIPREDKDCDGFWSTCDADCFKSYIITQWPSGDGAMCEFGQGEETECPAGEGHCPLETNGVSETIEAAAMELCTGDLCMGICCAHDGVCDCRDLLQSFTVDLLKSRFEVNQCACADSGEPNWLADRRKLKSRKRLLRL